VISALSSEEESLGYETKTQLRTFHIILVVASGPYTLQIWYLLVYVARLMTTDITRISQMTAHH
jgi:hypothetical protein